MADIFQGSDDEEDATRHVTCPTWDRLSSPLTSLLSSFCPLSQTDLIWSVDRNGAETRTVTAEFAGRGREGDDGRGMRPPRIQGMSKLTQKSELFVAKVKLLSMPAVAFQDPNKFTT